MTTMISHAEAAERLGLTARRIGQLADEAGFETRIGKMRVLTPGQYRTLASRHRHKRVYKKRSADSQKGGAA